MMKEQGNRRSGFALIISLMVMSLILVLILAMSSIMRVSMQEASNSMKVSIARQNAMYAVQEAIGNLQKFAGRDQRITALADFYGDGSTPDYWTGVWDSDPSSSQYKSRLAWLNSESLAAASKTGETVSFGDRYNNDSIPVSTATHLLMDINGNEGGKYGWVVNDEGVKARLGMRYLDEYEANDTYKAFVPGHPSIHPLSSMQLGNSDFEKLSRLISREQLPYVISDIGNGKAGDLYHNYSLQSMGVLSNTRDGGLKKNLSAAFSYSSEFSKLLNYSGQSAIFPPASTGSNIYDDPGGPLWEQLRSYYQLSEKVISGTNDSISMIAPSDAQSGVSPVMSQMQLFIYAALVQKPADATKYEVVWFFVPALVLWNPYDLELKTPDLYLAAYCPSTAVTSTNSKADVYYGAEVVGTMAKNDRKYVGMNVNNQTKSGSVKWVVKNRISSFSDLGAKPFKKGSYGPGDAISPNEAFKFKIPASSFAPGQAKVFSLTEHKELRNDAELNELVDVYGAGASFNNGFAFYRRTDAWVQWNSGDYDLWMVIGGEDHIYNFSWELNTASLFPVGGIVQKVENTPVWGIVSNTGIPYNLENNFYKAPLLQSIDTTNPIQLWDTVAGSTGKVSDRYPALGYKFSYIFPDNSADDFNGQKRLSWLGQHNPRSSLAGRSPLSIGKYQTKDWWTDSGIDQHATYYGTFATDQDWSQVQVNSSFDGAAVGTSDQTAGQSRTTLFTVPRKGWPLSSIAELSHANFNRNINYNGWTTSNYDTRYFYNNYMPGYALGNSIVDARIPSNLTEIKWADHPENVKLHSELTSYHYDYSYKLNEALYDRYFLSSLSYTDRGKSGNISFPLLNRKLVAYGVEPKEYKDIQDFDLSAEHLLVDGAFNVNSTSLDAWKSILGSYFSVQEVQTHEGVEKLGSESPLLRMIRPLSGKDGGTDPYYNSDAFNGFRALTKNEIDLLAEKIVAELKRRRSGKFPYMSMAEFVNRDPSSENQEYRLKGILQAAIDATGINAHFNANTYQIDASTEHLNDYPTGNMSGSVHAAAPGYLMQSDLLSRLDSILSARSDTFTILAYGCHSDPVTGKVLSEKKCEVVVQRTPDLVDLENNSTNRKFEIVSFRWL